MTSEVHAYLSSMETMTIFHLKDLASGKRKIMKSEKVQHFDAPHYEGLSIEDMLKFANDYPESRLYFPIDAREIKKLPREYIATMLYSIIKDPLLKD